MFLSPELLIDEIESKAAKIQILSLQLFHDVCLCHVHEPKFNSSAAIRTQSERLPSSFEPSDSLYLPLIGNNQNSISLDLAASPLRVMILYQSVFYRERSMLREFGQAN